MDDKHNKFIEWLAHPKWYFLLPIIIIAVCAIAGGTVIVTQDFLTDYMILGYCLLGVGGLTLGYSIFGVVRIYPLAKAEILRRAEKHPRLDRVFKEYGFTTLIITAGSLFVTLAFAVYNGSVAIVIRSIWFGALAAYYIVIIVLRSSILLYHGKRYRAVKRGQPEAKTLLNDNKLFLACGVLLFFLPICLSFAIMQMVRAGDSFEHKGITIYVYAIYAFFKIITAIYSFIKERKSNSMPIKAIRNIKLADAFVSILALQTAMFREFGGPDSNLSAVMMNAITGLVVCALTVAIGVYMIIKAAMSIKALRQAQAEIPAENTETPEQQGELDDRYE